VTLAVAAMAWGPMTAAATNAAAQAPRPAEYSYTWDMVDNSLIRPATRLLDPTLALRRLRHDPHDAANVDADDQVRLPSTWWQPRIGYRPVTVERMLDGAGIRRGPAPGRWSVTAGKEQGVTPGFAITDREGQRFLLKFDPPENPEMASGAEVIGTALFWAAGYNVPENSIVIFRPESLELAPGATLRDAYGVARPFTTKELDHVLSRAWHRPDGSLRAVASRFIPGVSIGPFKYLGHRKDDPEDLIPHERRRELRGLWALAAWTNHGDVRGPNTHDSWVTEGGRSFVRHYLIDFGSILGSSAIGPRSYVTGTEYYFDFGVMARELVTLGLAPFAWESYDEVPIPSVGNVEAKVFDARGWRPDYPNPAFDERTVRDVRWGARIVAAFTDEHIRAAVRAARYSDPRATDYLARVLIERRDKIARAWLGTPTTEARAE